MRRRITDVNADMEMAFKNTNYNLYLAGGVLHPDKIVCKIEKGVK